jgi:hypothetical protein
MNDRTKAIFGTVVSVLVAVLAVASEWSDMGPAFGRWALRGVALLTVASNVLGLKVVSLRRNPGRAAGAGAVLLGLVLIGVAAAGCTASPAVVATHGTMRAITPTGDMLARLHKAGKVDCTTVKRFRTIGRPLMRVTVAGAVLAIRSGKSGKLVLEQLKPAACEGTRWAALGSDEDKTKILAFLGSFKGLVCPKGKSVASVLAAILPFAQTIIDWVLKAVSSDDDKLLAEVDAYLAAPPKDGTDAICTGQP